MTLPLSYSRNLVNRPVLAVLADSAYCRGGSKQQSLNPFNSLHPLSRIGSSVHIYANTKTAASRIGGSSRIRAAFLSEPFAGSIFRVSVILITYFPQFRAALAFSL